MPPETERLSVYLPVADAIRIRAIAEQHGIGLNDALRRAVRLLDHAEGVWAEGGALLVERTSGVRELIPV